MHKLTNIKKRSHMKVVYARCCEVSFANYFPKSYVSRNFQFTVAREVCFWLTPNIRVCYSLICVR